MKLIYWDGSRIVMAYKRLEEHNFTWPGIKDGLMTLPHARLEALFAGLDWRRVHAVQTRTPEVEDLLKQNGGIYSSGPDWSSYAVQDGLLITGQNPGSSAETAGMLINTLRGAEVA
ncbi:IS66 family insertion sequence element accessory protein TnpB [Rhizobium sp. XQZ8]|nr:IS66 family insertion sequence element accessory protein TnpB [Rhizobium populisoli]